MHKIAPEIYEIAKQEMHKLICKLCSRPIGYQFIPDQGTTFCMKCGFSSHVPK